MKHILMSLALFGLVLFGAGCGGDTASEEEDAAEMEQETLEIQEQLPADL